MPDRDRGRSRRRAPGGRRGRMGGKVPGERPPVAYSNRWEDRRQAPTRGESSDTDEVCCRNPMPTVRATPRPRPTSSGTHGCAQCESWVGACLRSASTRCGGSILMGQQRFLALKAPAGNRRERLVCVADARSTRVRRRVAVVASVFVTVLAGSLGTRSVGVTARSPAAFPRKDLVAVPLKDG